MIRKTLCRPALISLFTLSLLACGKDPFSGYTDKPPLATGGSGLGGAPTGGGGIPFTGGAGGAGGAAGAGGAGGAGGAAGTTGIGAGGVAGAGQTTSPPLGYTDISISVSPVRNLDLVVMIDNSASMAPKQEKLKKQFPKLISALVEPTTGNLPNLHIAIIDSDLGTGGAYPDGSSCGRNPTNNNSAYGDMGKFRMPNAKNCGVTDPNAQFLVYENGKPANFTGDINSVFACLAGGLGTTGCGQEHQLQAFEWALINLGPDVGNLSQQQAFLRPMATLGLVFLTDEDDCSAAINYGLFGTSPGGANLSSESASLRCATRAHQCNSKNLTGLSPGYPTTEAFSADFATCAARTDSCPNPTNLTSSSGATPTDTSKPTSCSPLKDMKLLADEIKFLKPDAPSNVVVAGIFGWPMPGQAALPYKIDLIPNPVYQPGTTAKERIYDYWPICYDPNFMPKDSNAYDATAAWNGATGGLREAAFVDQFGENGFKYSVCEPDYKEAMAGIGSALANRLQNLCVDVELVDSDLNTPGLQPDCTAHYRTPVIDGSTAKVIRWTEDAKAMSTCPEYATPDSIADDCWQMLNDKAKCKVNGQFINVLRSRAHMNEGPIEAGTVLGLRCRSCSDSTSPGCDY